MSTLFRDLNSLPLYKCVNFLLDNDTGAGFGIEKGGVGIGVGGGDVLIEIMDRLKNTTDTHEYLNNMDVALVLNYSLLTEYSKRFIFLHNVPDTQNTPMRWSVVSIDTIEKTVTTNNIGKNIRSVKSFTEYVQTYSLKYKDVVDLLLSIEKTKQTATKHGVFYDTTLVSLTMSYFDML